MRLSLLALLALAVGLPTLPLPLNSLALAAEDPCLSGSPPPSCPPPPNNGSTQRAQNWNPTKYNNDMLTTPPVPSYNRTDLTGVPKGEAIRQADAIVANSNTLNSCITTSINGRTDSLCTNTPNHPECVGLSGAAESISTAECIEYFVPATLGCKVYAKNGFTMQEWAVFGDQYTRGIQECFSTKPGTDASADKMVSLTDMVTPASAGNDPSGSSRSQSGISESTIQDKDSPSATKDGSTYLGYEDGEIVQRAKSGDTFFDILIDSPFGSKLSRQQKAAIEDAKSNSDEIAEKALERQSKLADNSDKAAPDDTEASAVSDAERTPGRAVAPGAMVSAVVPPGALKLSQTPNIALQTGGKAAVAANAAGNGSAESTKRQPASSQAAKDSPSAAIAKDAEISLFARITLIYRKKAPGLKRLEVSETGRAIKSMDTPEFFKSL